MIKRLAVIPVEISVRRSELLNLTRCDSETVRSLFAKIRGKGITCNHSLTCGVCDHKVDFTNIIAKDVLISGLADEEVKCDVLGCHDLDTKTADETVMFIEAKEIARDALTRSSTASAISSTYKKNSKDPKNLKKTPCKDCGSMIEKTVWSKRQKKFVERNLCSTCWSNKYRLKTDTKQTSPSNASIQNLEDPISIGSVQTARANLLYQTY